MIVGFESVVCPTPRSFSGHVSGVDSNQLNLEGIPDAFLRGGAPVWPGRGNTTAFSPPVQVLANANGKFLKGKRQKNNGNANTARLAAA